MSCGLRDVLSFEQVGKPAVLVASRVFAQAAAEQSALLGARDLRRTFVDHPIQDRTDAELAVMADGCVNEIVAALTD